MVTYPQYVGITRLLQEEKPMPKKTASKTPRLRVMRCAITGKPIEVTDHAMWLVRDGFILGKLSGIPLALSSYYKLFPLPDRESPNRNGETESAWYLHYAIANTRGDYFVHDSKRPEIGAKVAQIRPSVLLQSPRLSQALKRKRLPHLF